VCTNPIGKKCIQENIDACTISFDPEKTDGEDSELKINGKTLEVRVNYKTLKFAVSSRYKERIEFIYDMIIPIAKSNSSQRHDQVEAVVKQKLGKAIPIDIDITPFAKDDAFRGKKPPDQADIITIMYADLPEIALSNADGLVDIFQYDVPTLFLFFSHFL